MVLLACLTPRARPRRPAPRFLLVRGAAGGAWAADASSTASTAVAARFAEYFSSAPINCAAYTMNKLKEQERRFCFRAMVRAM